MEGFKLKVSVGGAQIELEGSGDQVVALFQELREKGLGVLGEEMPLEKEKIKEQKEEIPARWIAVFAYIPKPACDLIHLPSTHSPA